MTAVNGTCPGTCPVHRHVSDDGGPWPRECTGWSWQDGTPVPCPALAAREDVERLVARLS